MKENRDVKLDEDIQRLYDRGNAILVKAASMAGGRSVEQGRAFMKQWNSDSDVITMQAIHFGHEPVVMRRWKPRKRDT